MSITACVSERDSDFGLETHTSIISAPAWERCSGSVLLTAAGSEQSQRCATVFCFTPLSTELPGAGLFVTVVSYRKCCRW